MKVIRLSFLLFLFTGTSGAQDINPGSRLLSMGNTGVALQDVWSMQANPAGIASLACPAAALTYQKNYPGTSLSTEAAVMVYPLKKHAFGLAFQSFGFSAYKELRMGLAYARKFGETVFTAVDFHYHQISVPSYGETRAFSIDAGFQYKPSSELIIGAHISNLSNSSYDQSAGADIPVQLSVGASYRFSEELLLSSSVVAANGDRGGDFRTGLEYCLMSQLAFRAGVGIHPFNQYAGMGYVFKRLSVDMAVSNHLVLGYNPQISLAYVF
ncbi:hypothetical protein B0I27_10443 [Arcticibacter pallidicorallinus]|uniref:PorV/PorQ family protein n=1 Tax=Arcticibacter pallidicorallinus TaxID=1259464 RepID=A0A2T0U536_9SPHI|nr:hypothetical protein [Arcticibacter pallidicorallinus]PRY53036.1 hypothetical protein B0I27_10443 [Arcticibacter pallidicorallinus]